ncbi:MAG TPA: SRPBCC family protein [Acidimicrobiales bacterium]|jgi:hypothetical protein|nr:SRPBCC family protein [Acidimicrobiales bacterium]
MARMSTVSRRIDVPVDVVAAVLADPRSYDGIVVGSKRVRWFDARWPEPGTSFHHSVGFGAIHVRDKTTVVRDELPDTLELAAGTGPVGTFTVTFRLAADGDGTMVTMEEGPRSGPITLAWSPPVEFATAKRNELALKRLEHLARMRHETRSLPDSPAVGSSAAG